MHKINFKTALYLLLAAGGVTTTPIKCGNVQPKAQTAETTSFDYGFLSQRMFYALETTLVKNPNPNDENFLNLCALDAIAGDPSYHQALTAEAQKALTAMLKLIQSNAQEALNFLEDLVNPAMSTPLSSAIAEFKQDELWFYAPIKASAEHPSPVFWVK